MFIVLGVLLRDIDEFFYHIQHIFYQRNLISIEHLTQKQVPLNLADMAPWGVV